MRSLGGLCKDELDLKCYVSVKMIFRARFRASTSPPMIYIELIHTILNSLSTKATTTFIVVKTRVEA